MKYCQDGCHQPFKLYVLLKVICALMYIMTVPPAQPVLQDLSNGSVVKVSHKTKVKELTCTSDGGKPGATIKWFKDGVEITEGITANTTKVGLVCNFSFIH